MALQAARDWQIVRSRSLDTLRLLLWMVISFATFSPTKDAE